ncbi:MAG TPA: homoserine dehydrogenase [Methanoregulaceae archaeon]|nr:homoserine dehydrogenase [Methanoregulaceae archaeon]HQJ87336.1 homoserine dehydrogenase [Methanoregulaceae archaeon]
MRIAVLGLGAVGKGVLRVLAEKPELGLVLTGVADSASGWIDPDGIDPGEVLDRKCTTNRCGTAGLTADDILDAGEFDVLVEVTPTNASTGEPALTYIRRALISGHHVVTSNKGPIAIAHAELEDLAREQGVALRYEATVGGAIPVIHAIRSGLLGNRAHAITGVLNGTCNYILTRMDEEGLTYDQALAEARELGYAEADPTYDVRGIDAAIKLVILANTCWNLGVTLNDVSITGIDCLTVDALRLAADQDCTIRLIAEASPERGQIRVAPRVLPRTHPLVIEGTLNAVTLSMDLAGEVTLMGRGAGSRETASAIVGDLLAIRDRFIECG